MPEQEMLQGQYGRFFYAPLTFSNTPDARRIEIGFGNATGNWRSIGLSGKAGNFLIR